MIHTDSPWTVERQEPSGSYMPELSDWRVRGGGSLQLVVAAVITDTAELKAEGEANARLIAASPDLLASLREIVEEWGYPNTPKWHRAKAAIAKAEGPQAQDGG